MRCAGKDPRCRPEDLELQLWVRWQRSATLEHLCYQGIEVSSGILISTQVLQALEARQKARTQAAAKQHALTSLFATCSNGSVADGIKRDAKRQRMSENGAASSGDTPPVNGGFSFGFSVQGS